MTGIVVVMRRIAKKNGNAQNRTKAVPSRLCSGQSCHQ
jgi:hypothetical protein